MRIGWGVALSPPGWGALALVVAVAACAGRTRAGTAAGDGGVPAAGMPRGLPAEAASGSAAPRTWTITPDLQVRELRPGVWLHTSWRTYPGGARVPSNGLVVRDGDHLLLVDTAWGDTLTEALLAWVDTTLRLPVGGAIATHYHDDRLGGAPALVRRGIPVRAHPLTRALALAHGLPLPDTLVGIARPGEAARMGAVEVFYPGPAHTRDNIMVWLPGPRVLFGGCAVRAGNATDRGNVADADTLQWATSIERAQRRYPGAELVVPGHGDPGGAELLEHTRALFR